MTLDNNIPLDISCLYAAKNIVPYIALRQPEAPKGTIAINKMQEILEAEGRKAVDSVSSLEDLTERNPQASETELKRVFSETYQSIMLKVRGTYKTLKDSGVLTEDDENEFEKFFTDFNEEDIPLFIYSIGTASARDATYVDKQAEAVFKEAGEKRKQYLASMQINTREGDTAEVIMSHSGRQIWRAMRQREEAGVVKISETDLEDVVKTAISGCLYHVSQEVPIENQEEVGTKVTEWLSREMNARLSQGLEFCVLDSISIRKGDDGFIYVRDDERKPYTI